MKKLKTVDKLIFVVNSIAAALLLLSYILPLVPPKTFPLLSVLSLGVPLLIILNALFLFYWLIKVKKQLLLPLIVISLGYLFFGSLYKFSNSSNEEESNSFTVMNYNVRLFNLYEWIESETVDEQIEALIKEKTPDILTIQEYKNDEIDLSHYPYQYKKLSKSKLKSGQVIFSKFPIINSGSIEFPSTSNNAIFVDVVKDDDTIRVYNLHLQSLKIDADVDKLKHEDSERLVKRIGTTFEMQQSQVELFLTHKSECKYPMIISGDFNNTAFSYVYKEIKGNLKDTFKREGNGFGRTFDFKFFPIRIDFILVDKSMTVNRFKTYDEKLSDHYPIMATLSFNTN